jgi:hypothetical protein
MPSRSFTKIRSWILSVGLLALLLFEARGIVPVYVKPYRDKQWAENVRHTKLSVKALEAQLRRDNVFGHVTEARVFGCEFTQAPPDERQGWDYICHLYWGTQPGVLESIHQMKFGAMVDASRITRLSGLVPEVGPAPPLSESPSHQ